MTPDFRHYPEWNLKFLRRTNFFPLPPQDLSTRKSICLGTKSRTIGDALVLSGLPEKLAQRFPHLKISTYPMGFNPVVFQNNPFVKGIQYMPLELFGDDINFGSGHLMQTKENYFGLPQDDCPRPRIYLSKDELEFADTEFSHKSLPIVFIHPWGGTHGQVLREEFWNKAVSAFSSRFHFWQIGIEGQSPVKGCQRFYLLPRFRWSARKAFALLSRAEALIGVDSGPMHIARSFNVPSLIFSNYCEIETLFSNRKKFPYYLKKNHLRGFLYEDNDNIFVDRKEGVSEYFQKIEEFLGRATKNFPGLGGVRHAPATTSRDFRNASDKFGV